MASIAERLPLLILLFFSSFLVQAQEKPDVIKKEFGDFNVTLPHYFENSDVVLLQTYREVTGEVKDLWRSNNAGQDWEKLEEIKEAWSIIMHPYDNKVAFIFSEDRHFWITHDQGETWNEHKLHDHLRPVPLPERDILSFHAGDPKKIILNAIRIKGNYFEEEAHYSTDGFQKPSHLKLLRKETRGCSWIRSTQEFRPLEEESDDRIMCMVQGKFSYFDFDQRLVVSDNFFKHDEKDGREPTMSNGRTIQGIFKIAHTKGYLVAAARAEKTRELAMFVSINGLNWHRAEFHAGHTLQERSYTVLESTNYSLQVAVATTKNSAILMSSNSNGTYFSESITGLRRNDYFFFVDFEKVMGFQGVILVNILGDEKEIESRISFNDGKNGSWTPLKADDKNLHLHSVTEKNNPGRVYSSAAPGVLMGIGNSGKGLGSYEKEGNLYISNDAGRNWKLKLEGPHKYAFGDHGNILLAIPDKRNLHKGSYSTDHGKNWKSFSISEDSEIEEFVILTAPDSSSRTFLVVADIKTEERMSQVVYSIDFDNVLERTCEDGDMESFQALLDNEPCVMGHRQIYLRRKPDAECFVRSKPSLPQSKPCPCEKDDFECDVNFIPKDNGCVPARLERPEECKNPDQTFRRPSGFRLVPGNECTRKGGEYPDEPIDHPCSDTAPPQSGEVHSEKSTPFRGERHMKSLYLEPSRVSSNSNETVILMTENLDGKRKVYKSLDKGKNWELILADENVIEIFPHQYNTDAVFFITDTDKVFFSYNRGLTHNDYFKVRYHYNPKLLKDPFSFHQDNKDRFIWTGSKEKDCKKSSETCYLVSEYTNDRGNDWDTIRRKTEKCEFIKREGRDGANNAENLIYCGSHRDEIFNGPVELVRSDDKFATSETVFEDIVNFETTSEFVVAAGQDENDFLFINASVAGGNFAAAHFPPGFSTLHTGFTVLQSETHCVMLLAQVSKKENHEFGRLLKSNSNGTFYVTSIDNVNQDDRGYVDFKKVDGLEGISIVNIVTNPDDSEAKKLLQTRITHNDGAAWAAIDLPGGDGMDSSGRKYECVKNQDKCKLHLYGFTMDRTPHASASGVGVLVGNGNVGEFLDTSGNKDATFISTDGGMSWEEKLRGRHLWAYGDQGSIIAFVQRGETGTLNYTTDEGKTWGVHTFSQEAVKVFDLSSAPSDNSKSFLVWAMDGADLVVILVDFSETRDRDCRLNEEDPNDESQDYYRWSPKHPSQKNADCLFGHKAIYHRKKIDSTCWNGPLIDSHGLHSITENCPCIREDYECDYNYELKSDGQCLLVQGLDKPDHEQACRDNSSLINYYEPTGYRRIPLDTCESKGGLNLLGEDKACPGHEEEYENMHRGLGGFALFLVAIVLPLSIAVGVGCWVYQRWDGKFGAIRLGESPSDNVLDTDKPWVKFPIMVASAVVAVALATPGILASAWRVVQSLVGRSGGRYTTRASFARNRGEYTIVDEDEDELLGNEEDEDAGLTM